MKPALTKPIEDYLAESFPWHLDAYRHYLQYQVSGMIPSGLIIDGQKGVGKSAFAKLIAKSLLCENKQSHFATVCFKCSSCQLVDQDNHPNLIKIGLEEGSKQIKLYASKNGSEEVLQINDLIQLLIYSESKAKVAIINPADAINLSAANALLKTLEELGLNKYILFITNQSHRLPATIVSRCQRISLKVLKNQALNHWWLGQTNQSQLQGQERQVAIDQLMLLLDLNNQSVFAAKEFREKINLVFDFWKYLDKLRSEKISPQQLAGLIAKWDKDFIGLAFLALIQIGLYQSAIYQSSLYQNETQNNQKLKDPSFNATKKIEQLAQSLFPTEDEQSLTWFFDFIKALTNTPFEVLNRFYQDIEKVHKLLQTPVNQNLLFENLLIIFCYLDRIDCLEKYPDTFNYQQFSLKK